MEKKLHIERSKSAIERTHHCQAKWVATGAIEHKVEGERIWKGEVETFVLIGHPKARRAFGWVQPGRGQTGEPRFVVVLEIPPVISAQTAVHTSFAGVTTG